MDTKLARDCLMRNHKCTQFKESLYNLFINYKEKNTDFRVERYEGYHFHLIINVKISSTEAN